MNLISFSTTRRSFSRSWRTSSLSSWTTTSPKTLPPSLILHKYPKHHLQRQQQQQQRSFAVYTIGDGWTGAMGTGTLQPSTQAVGHDDEEETDPPIQIYDGQVSSMAVGWGHTAVITSEENPKVLVCGRPHDFQALLRLRRIPDFVRSKALQYALHKYNVDPNLPEEKQQEILNNPGMVGQLFEFLMGPEASDNHNSTSDTGGPLWRDARKNSILTTLQPMELPHGDTPSDNNNTNNNVVLDASAGLTAVIGQQQGTLYTFGINHQGQCGVGKSSNNVWIPQKVMGLSTVVPDDEKAFATLEQEYPIVSVALGLQHGVALNDQGQLYAWGKAERGQLGQGSGDSIQRSDYAIRIRDFRLPSVNGRRRVMKDPTITKIATGMNHSAALTTDNQVFVWGKNSIAPPPHRNSQQENGNKPPAVAMDSKFPTMIQGLPPSLQVLDIACGSHHTAVLLEDGSVFALGVTTDTKVPLFECMELIPPGMIDMPCRQFAAHFDRTLAVGSDGTQVLMAHLWEDMDFQENAVFTPPWVDHLLEDNKTIRAIHRGWLHTAISTD